MLINSNGHMSNEKNKKVFIDFMMDNCHTIGIYYDDLTDEQKKMVKPEKINSSKRPHLLRTGTVVQIEQPQQQQ
jgi:hypothetical protein